MDSNLFAMKRVYYKSLETPRSLLKKYNLTPARFDVLRAIYAHSNRECYRIDLVSCLGTVKSNVWRLCDALEELGLAYTDWDPLRIIHLTRFGVALVEQILAETGHAVAEIVDACSDAAHEIAHGLEDGRANRREKLSAFLLALRKKLGDERAFDVYAPELHVKLRELVTFPRLTRYWRLGALTSARPISP